jgi:hypothetical protein
MEFTLVDNHGEQQRSQASQKPFRRDAAQSDVDDSEDRNCELHTDHEVQGGVDLRHGRMARVIHGLLE